MNIIYVDEDNYLGLKLDLIEKYGNNIKTVVNYTDTMYKGEIDLYRPKSVDNKFIDGSIVIELFVEINDKYFLLDKRIWCESMYANGNESYANEFLNKFDNEVGGYF